MGLIQQFLKSFRETDEMEPGLIQKPDGTVWLVNPDGSEVQLTGGGGGGAPVPFTAGHGTPVGVVTPASLGALYVDIDGGGLYIAATVVDSEYWVSLGGDVFIDNVNTGEAAGQFGNRSITILLANRGGFSALTDVPSFDADGTANAIYWRMNSGLDGAQTAEIRTGAAGEFTGILQDANGVMKPAAGFDASNLPTSDPGITGLVWTAQGVLILSGASPPSDLTLTGWSEDSSDPANVSTEGGGIDLGSGTLAAESGQILIDDFSNFAEVKAGGVIAGSDSGAEDAETYTMRVGHGVTSTPATDVPAFTAIGLAGGTVALDAGGLTIINLPTSDPHIATALYTSGGTVHVSSG